MKELKGTEDGESYNPELTLFIVTNIGETNLRLLGLLNQLPQ